MNRGINVLGLVLVVASFLARGVSAQETSPRLVDEFRRSEQGGCAPFFRLTSFMDELQKAGSGTGLVVVYDGGSDQRFGNLMAFVRNAPKWLTGVLKWPAG